MTMLSDFFSSFIENKKKVLVELEIYDTICTGVEASLSGNTWKINPVWHVISMNKTMKLFTSSWNSHVCQLAYRMLFLQTHIVNVFSTLSNFVTVEPIFGEKIRITTIRCAEILRSRLRKKINEME